VEWLPFDLHPEYPPEGIPRSELDRRYGEEHRANVRRMVEECGYTYNPPPDVVPNSRKALEVTELARELGLHEAVHTRLMDAYWSEAADIGQEDTLLSLAAEAGVPRDQAGEAIAESRFRGHVLESTRQANLVGINAIPAFVLDDRMLLVGAHPHATFERAFEELARMTADERGS
jgi:predicted DsbA family dithiol-disulfide isomerase